MSKERTDAAAPERSVMGSTGPADEVLDCLTAGVVGIDYDERVGLYSAGAAHTLGVPPDDVVGRPLRDLVDAPQPIGAVARVIVAEGLDGRCPRSHTHMELQTAEGRRTIGYRLHVMGETWLALMVFDDLTDALALERRAAEDRTVGDVGRMASTIAHDLKSPLATISIYAGLARDEIADDSPAGERLGVIQAQVDECRQRLSGLLTMLRGHTGVSIVALCDPSEVVTAVVDERRGQHADASLSLDVLAEAGHVLLAERELASVVGNLVGNALDVSPEGEPVGVRCETVHGWFELRVLDRGPGLPEHDVFRPFSSTKSQGTGLGLWLARRTVERAAGAIACGDRAGGGAEFVVRLPYSDVERLSGRRFLVVDDDEQFRGGLSAALEHAGAVVTAAGSTEEVDELAIGLDDFDGLLLDYRLPGRTGLDLAREASPATAVVIISGDPEVEAAMEGSAANLRLVLKPFEADELLEALSILIRG